MTDTSKRDTDEVDTMTLETTTSSIPAGTVVSDAAGDEAVAGERPAGLRPRIRSGAIVWGLVVCGIAIAVLLVIGSPESRSGFADWLGGLTPGGYVLIAVLALGGLILLWGLLGLIRRIQRGSQPS